MIQFLHEGIAYSAPLDATQLTGDNAVDSVSPYIQGLKAGRFVTLGENGVRLADGGSDSILGSLRSDAAGRPWDNQPALASGKIAVEIAAFVAESDQLVDGETYAAGTPLYVGTWANAGLVTDVAPNPIDYSQGFIGVAGTARAAGSTSVQIVAGVSAPATPAP